MTPDMWHSIAEDVLAALLVENYIAGESQYFDYAYYEAGLSEYYFPTGRWQSLYSAIVSLRLDDEAVNWNTIVDRVVSTVGEDWFADVVTMGDAMRLADFVSNVRSLLELGERMRTIERFECAAEALRRGVSVENLVDRTISDLTLSGNRHIERETAEGSFGRIISIFEEQPQAAYSTGINFVDTAIGGMSPGRLMMLVGPYKSRKTTIALNLMLSAFDQGASCAFLSFENSIEVTALQLVAMLAVRWMRQQPETLGEPEAIFWISGDMLMRVGVHYKEWKSVKRRAVDYARDQLAQMGDRIRFYDRSDSGGALSDMASIRAVVSRDKRLYGGDWYCVDHQGLIDASGEIYESTRYISKEMQALSRASSPNKAFLCVLSQMSEAAIKARKAYSSGAKGGGDSNANADFVLRTMPIRDPSGGDDKYYDDRIKLQVKHNRWGTSTGFQQVFFHPQSGLHSPDKRDEEGVEA